MSSHVENGSAVAGTPKRPAFEYLSVHGWSDASIRAVRFSAAARVATDGGQNMSLPTPCTSEFTRLRFSLQQSTSHPAALPPGRVSAVQMAVSDRRTFRSSRVPFRLGSMLLFSLRGHRRRRGSRLPPIEALELPRHVVPDTNGLARPESIASSTAAAALA